MSVIFTRLRALNGKPNPVVLTRIRGVSLKGNPVVLTRLRGLNPVTQITAGDNQVWDPFQLVVMTAGPADVSSPPPATYTWRQTAGPAVPFTVDVNGATCQFVAPATVDGLAVTFEVAASGVTAQTTQTVRRWCGPFRYVGGVLVGSQMLR